MHLSDQRVTGVLVGRPERSTGPWPSRRARTPPPDIGIDSFEFWLPQRRPGGKNFALKIEPPLDVFGAANLIERRSRARPASPTPGSRPSTIEQPTLRADVGRAADASRAIELMFDTDFDHPMESVLWATRSA